MGWIKQRKETCRQNERRKEQRSPDHWSPFDKKHYASGWPLAMHRVEDHWEEHPRSRKCPRDQVSNQSQAPPSPRLPTILRGSRCLHRKRSGVSVEGEEYICFNWNHRRWNIHSPTQQNMACCPNSNGTEKQTRFTVSRRFLAKCNPAFPSSLDSGSKRMVAPLEPPVLVSLL